MMVALSGGGGTRVESLSFVYTNCDIKSSQNCKAVNSKKVVS